jgi:TetR/AcrR family transcriptional regulator, transcriptional repressor of bet genes
MARPSNREERRRQILLGFQQSLARYGYEKATISSIAKAAGLTSGLIHYHFSSKLEILLELVNDLGDRLNQRFESLLQGRSDPLTQLAAFIDSRLSTGPGADPQAVACWVAIGTESLRQPEVQQAYRSLMQKQFEQLTQIVQQITNTADQSKETAAALLAAVEGCYQLAAAVPEMAPPGFAARSVRRMAEGLLSCKLPS